MSTKLEVMPKKEESSTEQKQQLIKNGSMINSTIFPCNDVKNRFFIFGLMTEREIETIVISETSKEDSSKKKCRRCNYRSYCHLNITWCRAFHRNCFKCNGNGHFPQSKNCKATRQEKMKDKNKIIAKCLNLETKSTEMKTNPNNTIGCNKFVISPYLLKLIEQQIRIIEKCQCDHDTDLSTSPLRLRGGGSEMPYKLPAFQSLFPAVDAIATIFRSLQEDWSYFNSHPVCSHSLKKETGYPCFLCYIRNISNRICKPKQTRMKMQPSEILSQLDQFIALVNHDFTDKSQSVKIMLEKTLELMNIYHPKFLEENKNLSMECSKCHKQMIFGETNFLEVDVSKITGEKLLSVIEAAALKCCKEHSKICDGKVCLTAKQKFLFIYFKEPKNIQIPLNYILLGENFKYKSHLREVSQDSSFKYETHFVHEDHQYVDDNGIIRLSASTEYDENVKIIILTRLQSVEKQLKNVDLFSTNAMMSIRRRAVSITDPDKHSQHLQRRENMKRNMFLLEKGCWWRILEN